MRAVKVALVVFAILLPVVFYQAYLEGICPNGKLFTIDGKKYCGVRNGLDADYIKLVSEER